MIRLNPRWSPQDQDSLKELGEWALAKASSLVAPEIFATSGTTAQSVSRIKLVLLDQPALAASASMVNAKFQVTAKDIWLNPLPLFHVGGFGIQKRAEISNSEVSSFEAKWDPIQFVKVLHDRSVSLTSLVPTQIFDLVKAQLKAPSKLRLVFVGGSALSPTLLSQAQELGWPLVMTYGMTETSSMIAVSDLKSASALRFFDSVQFRVDSVSKLLSINAEVLLSYYAFYDANGEKCLVDPKQDSWFQTSDRVELGSENELTVLGRASDQVKILGELVDLHKLRQSLSEVLSTSKLQAGSLYLDSLAQERSGAEIVLYVGRDLSQQMQEVLAVARQFDSIVRPYERISKIFQVPKLPRSDLGKVLVAELRGSEKTEVKYE